MQETTTINSPLFTYIETVIEQFLTDNGIEYDAASGFYSKKSRQTIDERTVLNHFLLYSAPLNFFITSTDKRVKISQSNFEAAFTEYKKAQWAKAIASIQASFSYDPSVEEKANSHLCSWLKSILWREPTEIEIAVMKHFLHQVKRKLYGKPVSYHLMPVIIAAQGSGKTLSVNWLTRPLGKLAKYSDITALEDSRNDLIHEKCFIMIFDELARADRSDIRKLKERISSETVNTRLFRTQDHVEVKQNSTFIGTSNDRVDSLLADATGMRRFAQIIGPDKKTIDSMSEKDKQDFWKLKDTADAKVIWRGINESVEILPEYLEALKEIESQQEELRYKDSVEEFITENEYVSSYSSELSPASTPHTTNQALYDEYKIFCETIGEKYPLTRQKFSRRLCHFGFVKATVQNQRGFFMQKQSRAKKAEATLAKIATLKTPLKGGV